LGFLSAANAAVASKNPETSDSSRRWRWAGGFMVGVKEDVDRRRG